MVVRSNTKAELRALAQGIYELLWLKRIMDELSLKIENLTPYPLVVAGEETPHGTETS